MANATLYPLDIIIVVVYMLFLLGVALYVTFKKKKNSKAASSENYFLAGRDTPFWAVSLSLLASNIGSEHFIGLASSGMEIGLSAAWGEWLSPWCMLLLCWVFLPFYLGSNIFTMPEFLEKRYSKHCRLYLAVVSLILYVLTKISVALYGSYVFLNYLLGWTLWESTIGLLVATGLYTVLGGLSAVIYTEVVQAVLLIVGAFTVMGIGFLEVGGWSELKKDLPSNMTNLVMPANDRHFPWTGVLFGMPFTSIWYWTTDQVIVQRALSAKTLADGQLGTVLAGYLKVLPVFMMVFPGLIAHQLFRDDPSVTSDVAFPALVAQLLPSGALGLMVAAVLAALMSSLASVFNSSSTIFTMDIYRHFHPGASDRTLVNVGRVSTLVLCGIGIAWIPVISLLSDQLYIYMHKVMSYIAPPITVVFLAGVFSHRANHQGALAALLFGFVVGQLRLVLELVYGHEPHPNGFILVFVQSNFLHFTAVYGVASAIVLAAVSLMYPAPDPASLSGLVHGKLTYHEFDASSGSERPGLVRSGHSSRADRLDHEGETAPVVPPCLDDDDDEEGGGGGGGGGDVDTSAHTMLLCWTLRRWSVVFTFGLAAVLVAIYAVFW